MERNIDIKKYPEFDKILHEFGIVDSIEYNIIKRDSIIVQIKDSIIYELHLNQTADDSTVIVNFQKLLSD